MVGREAGAERVTERAGVAADDDLHDVVELHELTLGQHVAIEADAVPEHSGVSAPGARFWAKESVTPPPHPEGKT